MFTFTNAFYFSDMKTILYSHTARLIRRNASHCIIFPASCQVGRSGEATGIPCVGESSSCRKSRAWQNTPGTFCVVLVAPPAGMNFFFTKKWVDGRSSLRKVSARQGATSLYRLKPHPFTPLKRRESKGTRPRCAASGASQNSAKPNS